MITIQQALDNARVRIEALSDKAFYKLCHTHHEWYAEVEGDIYDIFNIQGRVARTEFIFGTDPIAVEGGLLDFLHKEVGG